MYQFISIGTSATQFQLKRGGMKFVDMREKTK